jgi:hypothetical protein
LWAIASNRLPLNKDEFEEKATFFKAGTIFVNYGKPAINPDEDEDCIENHSMHGWCYEADYSKSGAPFVHYCNFLAYVLDYWPSYPELFEKAE